MNAKNTVIPNGEVVIQVQGLTKSYGKVRALRGIDLQVQRGEIFGFLGPALCVSCHDAKVGKPEGYPQVHANEHAEEGPCTACHQPHNPAIS